MADRGGRLTTEDTGDTEVGGGKSRDSGRESRKQECVCKETRQARHPLQPPAPSVPPPTSVSPVSSVVSLLHVATVAMSPPIVIIPRCCIAVHISWGFFPKSPRLGWPG